MKKRRLLFVIAAVFTASRIVLAADAVDLVRKAGTADERVSYRGIKKTQLRYGNTYVYAALKIVHSKPDKTRIEYYSPSHLAGTVMIENGLNRWKMSSCRKTWEHIHYVQNDDIDRIINSMLSNYTLQISGKATIAGREAYLVNALPKTKGEPARKLWIDTQTQILLGIETDSPLGYVLNSSKFAVITINPKDIDPSVFNVTHKDASADNCNQRKLNASSVVQPAYLPKGYRMTRIVHMKVNDEVCAHLQFSNGANIISLFELPETKKSPPARVDSRTTNVITWAKDGMRYTVMGEVSRTELKKIADSIK